MQRKRNLCAQRLKNQQVDARDLHILRHEYIKYIVIFSETWTLDSLQQKGTVQLVINTQLSSQTLASLMI